MYLENTGCQSEHYGIGIKWLFINRVEGRPKDELADVVLEVAALAKKYLDES